MADTLLEPEVVLERRSRRPVIVALTLMAALLAGVLWVGWWWTHPNRFDGTNGQGYTVSVDARPVGSTALFGEMAPTSSVVTLLSAQPNITMNTAHASVDVLLCTAEPTALAAGYGPLASWCSSVRDVRGAAYRGLDGSDNTAGKEYLLIVVTPHWPGKVQVEGMRIRYRDGLRTGTQVIGGTYVTSAR